MPPSCVGSRHRRGQRPGRWRGLEARAEAKAEAQAKAKAKAEIETAKSAPVDVESENSTISTASVDKSDTEKVELAPAGEPKVSKAVSCKKFFPTVGMTLTVPCE